MTTRAFLAALSVLTFLPAGPLAAQPSSPPASRTEFNGLWTTWAGVNRESMRAEAQGGVPAAPAAGTLRAGSPELGAQVGEFVRTGNCAEGERIARAAGDFPLVEAVRAHCRSGAVQVVSRR